MQVRKLPSVHWTLMHQLVVFAVRKKVPKSRRFSSGPLFPSAQSNDIYRNPVQSGSERPVRESHECSRGSAGAKSGTSASSVTACLSARQPIPHNPRPRPPLMLPREVGGCARRQRAVSITLSGSWAAGGGALMRLFFFSPLKSGSWRSGGSKGAE